MTGTWGRAARLRPAALAMFAAALAALGLAARADAGYIPLGERVIPTAVAVDHASGTVYAGAGGGTVCRVLAVRPNGIAEVLVGGSGTCQETGDGGPASDAETNTPHLLAVDNSSNVYVAASYTVRRVSNATGEIDAWAGRPEYTCQQVGWRGPGARVGAVAAEVAIDAAGMAIDPASGHLFVTDACTKSLVEIDEAGVIVSKQWGSGTELWILGKLAFSPEGTLYAVTESYNQISRLEAGGRFVVIAGNGESRNGGDGGPATLAEFSTVTGIAVDSAGWVYFGTSQGFVRAIDPEGTIHWVGGHLWPGGEHPPRPGQLAREAGFSTIAGLAFDADDNLLLSDSGDETLLSFDGPSVDPESTVTWILHERVEILEGERRGGGNPSTNDCDQGCYGDPVNTASGEYWERQVDLELPGRGPALAFERAYSAQSGDSGALGRGWTANYLMSLDAGGPGGLVTIHQENGSTIAFEPNGRGGYLGPTAYLARLAANEGGGWTLTRRQRERYVFDAEGRLVRQLDLNGETTTLAYDEAGRLATVTDPAGRTLRLEYDGSNRIRQLDDSAGRTVRYGYTSGDLTSVVDVRGRTWTYDYDGQHRLTRRIDPNGNVDVENAYDAADRVVIQEDGNGATTAFSYQPGMTQIRSPEGRVRRDWYGSGQLLERQEGVGTADEGSWRFAYDATTHGTTSVIDPNGHVWRATYDAAGRRTSTADPLGHTTSATWSSLGDLLTFTDENNVTTTSTYDEQGNLLTTSTPLSGTEQSRVVRFIHGDEAHPGDVTAVVDPRERATQLSYHATGLLASVTDPLGNRATMAYDAAGHPRTVVSPRGNQRGGSPERHTTTYGYDAAGLLTEAADALGRTTRWSYDDAGNLASTTDPERHATAYGYDDADLLTSIERPGGTTLRRAYDGDGNLTSTTDGARAVTSHGYDARNRLTSTADPLRRVTRRAYDAAGNLTGRTDAAERTTTYGYDDANRLTSIAYSDRTTPNVTIGYDDAGLRTSMRDGSGTTSYTWDSLGRLAQHTDGAGHTVRYGYDLAGNQMRLTYPTSDVVTRAYDDAGRLASVTEWVRGATTFEYDADSNLTLISFPGANGKWDVYEYDDAGAISSWRLARASLTRVMAGLAYTRDDDGLQAQVVGSGSIFTGLNVSSVHTGLHQLASEDGNAYDYDAADNLTQLAGVRPLAYDAAHELTEGPVAPGSVLRPATFGYDAGGNRTSATPEGGSATRYAYDQEDRLIGFTPPSGGRATYAYDGDGLRTAKAVGETSETFAWDLSGPLPLLLSDGARSYIYGPGGMPIAHLTRANVARRYHHDALGSTRVLTIDDTAGGGVVGGYRYAPFGSVTASGVEAPPPLGFAGEYTDAESGLVYLRARYYDPATGQFLTRDPLESPGGEPYGYAGNSPLAQIDPSGLEIGIGYFMQEFHDAVEAGGMFISESAGRILNGMTGGVSNALAGVDGSCAGIGYRLAGVFDYVPFSIGRATRGARAIKEAATPRGKVIQDLVRNRGSWSHDAAHIELSTNRRYKGGVSIEDVWSRGDEVIYEHSIHPRPGSTREPHLTYRERAKFGQP